MHFFSSQSPLRQSSLDSHDNDGNLFIFFVFSIHLESRIGSSKDISQIFPEGHSLKKEVVESTFIQVFSSSESEHSIF